MALHFIKNNVQENLLLNSLRNSKNIELAKVKGTLVNVKQDTTCKKSLTIYFDKFLNKNNLLLNTQFQISFKDALFNDIIKQDNISKEYKSPNTIKIYCKNENVYGPMLLDQLSNIHSKKYQKTFIKNRKKIIQALFAYKPKRFFSIIQRKKRFTSVKIYEKLYKHKYIKTKLRILNKKYILKITQLLIWNMLQYDLEGLSFIFLNSKKFFDKYNDDSKYTFVKNPFNFWNFSAGFCDFNTKEDVNIEIFFKKMHFLKNAFNLGFNKMKYKHLYNILLKNKIKTFMFKIKWKKKNKETSPHKIFFR